MGEGDRDGDDRTFRVNFAGDGAARLRGSVKEKLKEYMGDYTDDTLVEYVVVLLRNGRSKEEAKRELNVFLGDDSDSFVSWLWDHLSINLHLYVQPKESLPDESAIRKTTANVQFGGSNTQIVEAGAASHTDSEHEIGNLINFSRSRRKREWKGLMGEMTESFPLRSTVTETLHSGEKASQITDIRHSSPPRPQFNKKRGREDERLPMKRDPNIFPKIAPPRRLLEFAVRDAVKTVQQSSSKTDPAVKRLRSVISASMDTMLDERSQRPRSTLRMPGSVSVALKAAAEAAEDVTKSRNAGSVFDRLGHDRTIVVPIDQSSNLKEHVLQDDEIEEFDKSARSRQGDYNKKNEYDGEFARNSSILDRDADPADSASDNDAYDDFGISSGHGLDASHSAYTANKRENSVMLHYNDSDADAVVRKTRLVPQDPRPSALAKPASKIVNISVNVNTWKPPDYQVSRKVVEGENQLRDKIEGTNLKPNVLLLKGSTSSVAGNGKEMASTDTQKEPQKPQASTHGVSYNTSRPSEDVDTRTIFISNVHFAATKDTLSRHFNKFGEVLKVIIMTDPTAGQPIGSAYVEFLRKESAELALSLNGTSFMSRILKVVRRSSVEAPVMGWPRIARASPFPSRLGRLPFPRGILPGTLRPRLPVKTGARSLQWKRDAGASHTTGGAKSFQNASGHSFANVGRSLTYVRPEPKNLGNSGVDF